MNLMQMLELGADFLSPGSIQVPAYGTKQFGQGQAPRVPVSRTSPHRNESQEDIKKRGKKWLEKRVREKKVGRSEELYENMHLSSAKEQPG